MRMKEALVILLASSLAVPTWSAPTVVGMFADGQGAMVRGAWLSQGTTLFSGDVVSVKDGGRASLQLNGGAQLLLGSSSRVQLLQTADAKSLQVAPAAGRIILRNTPDSPVVAILGDATIRSIAGSPAVGYVNILSPTKATIGAVKGEWLISVEHDGQNVRLREGQGMEVRIAPDAPAGSPPTPDSSNNNSNKKGLIILVGIFMIGGVTAGAIAATLNESGHGPNVSPFTPK